jgi:hypothetical protein
LATNSPNGPNRNAKTVTDFVVCFQRGQKMPQEKRFLRAVYFSNSVTLTWRQFVFDEMSLLNRANLA